MSSTLFHLMDSKRFSSPALVFDRSLIRKKIAELSEHQKTHGFHFLMAVKAFPVPESIENDFSQFSGFDVSNHEEYRLLPSDLRSKTVWLTDPTGQSAKNIDGFLTKRNRLIVTCETGNEMAVLQSTSRDIGFVIRIRASRKSRFGIDSKDCLLKQMKSPMRKRFLGFHAHRGFGPSSSADYVKSARRMREVAARLGLEPQVINLGGGAGALGRNDWEQIADGLAKWVPKATEIFFEPGRALSESAGFAVATIQKIRRGARTLDCVLDLSQSCHLRWAKPAWVNSMIEESKTKGAQRLTVRWFGPTCSEYDQIGETRFFGKARDLALIREGSRVVFSRIPGYSVAWNRGFNGIPAARVVLMDERELPAYPSKRELSAKENFFPEVSR